MPAGAVLALESLNQEPGIGGPQITCAAGRFNNSRPIARSGSPRT
jgi:hypothetical protein